MKRFFVILLTMAIAFSLTGCFFNGNGNDPNTGGGTEDGGDTNGNGPSDGDEKKEPIRIFITEQNFYVHEADLINDIFEITKRTPILTNDESAEIDGYEFAFGNTDREITSLAYEYLDQLDITSNDAVFLVYRNGLKTAVIWTHPAICASDAVDYFLDTFLEKYGLDTKSVAEYVTVPIMEYEARIEEEKWAQVAASATPETLTYLKKIYAFYGDDTWTWVANLYDPDIGGFYYSNSARDYYGVGEHMFLPDVESTAQALSILTRGGMFGLVGGDYVNAFSDEFKDKLGSFVYNLQHEDGYFYHPQWGTDISTAGRSRNLGASTTILSKLGITPKYKLPTDQLSDMEGFEDISLPLTEPIRNNSTVASVSHVLSSTVISTGAGIKDYLKSEAAFLEYLRSLDFETDSYASGHTLSSQAKEIKAAGLAETCISFLDSIQNPENGIWEDVIDYDTISGLLKISTTYQSLGGKLNYADKAFKSAMSLVLADAQPNAMTRLYNPIVAVSNILNNLTRQGSEAEIRAIMDYAKSVEEEFVKITYKKLIPFYRGDGGFSYYHKVTSSAEYSTSQGNAVSLNILESETNATNLSLGAIRAMFKILGYDYIPVFDNMDLDNFLTLIYSMGSIIKTEYNEVEEIGTPPILTFDGVDLPESVAPKMATTNGAYCNIVTDPIDSDNSLLEFRSLPGYTDYLYFTRTSSSVEKPNCFIFSADVNFAEIKDVATTDIRLVMDGLYYLSFASSKGTITLKDSSNMGDFSYTNELPFKLKTGKTYNITLKYHTVDKVAYIETYIDGVLMNVSDNFIGRSTELIGDDAAIASTKYKRVHFFAYKNSDLKVHIDNVFLDRTSEDFTPPDEFNVPVETEKAPDVIGFEGSSQLPSNVIASVKESEGAECKIVTDPSNSQNKVLSLTSVPGYGDTIYFERRGTTSLNPNCFVYSLDLNLQRVEDVTTSDIRLVMDGLYYVTVSVTGGKIVFTDNSNVSEGAITNTMPFTLDVGTKYKVTFKYHLVGERAYIETYIDGILMYVSDNYVGRSSLLSDGEQPAASRTYKQALLFAYKGSDLTLYIDNVYLDRTEESFEAPRDPDKSGPPEMLDFEDSVQLPSSITPSLNGLGNGSSAEIIEDSNDGGNKKLAIKSAPGYIDTLTIKRNGSTSLSPNCFVLSLDINFVDVKDVTTSDFRIVMEGLYLVNIAVTNGNVVFTDNSSNGDFSVKNTLPFTLKTGTTYKLTFKYHIVGERAYIETYVDGILACVSDNYIGRSSELYDDEQPKASVEYNQVQIFAYKNSDLLVYIDNILLDRTEEVFTPPSNESRPAGNITFDESTELPAGIKTSVGSDEGSISVIPDDRENSDGNVLLMSTKSGGIESVTFEVGEVSDKRGNCFVFESDLCFDDSTVNKVIGRVDFGGLYEIKLRSDKAGYLRIQNIDAGTSDYLYSVKFGEWFTLRIEFYIISDSEAKVITYVGDEVIEELELEYSGERFTEVEIYSLKDGVYNLYFDDVLTDIVSLGLDENVTV